MWVNFKISLTVTNNNVSWDLKYKIKTHDNIIRGTDFVCLHLSKWLAFQSQIWDRWGKTEPRKLVLVCLLSTFQNLFTCVSYIMSRVFSCMWQENSVPTSTSQQRNFASTKCLRVLTTSPDVGQGWGFHPTSKQHSHTSWLSSTPRCHRLRGESVSSHRSGAQSYKTANHRSDSKKLEVLTIPPRGTYHLGLD